MRIEKQMLNDALRVLGKAVYQTSLTVTVLNFGNPEARPGFQRSGAPLEV